LYEKINKKSPINISRCQPSHNMPRAFKDNKPGVFEIEGDLNSCLDFGKKKVFANIKTMPVLQIRTDSSLCTKTADKY